MKRISLDGQYTAQYPSSVYYNGIVLRSKCLAQRFIQTEKHQFKMTFNANNEQQNLVDRSKPTSVRTHMLICIPVPYFECVYVGHVSEMRICVRELFDRVYVRWFVHWEASTFELVQFLTGLLLKMPLAGVVQS